MNSCPYMAGQNDKYFASSGTSIKFLPSPGRHSCQVSSCHEMFVSPDLQILLILSWWLQHAGGWYPCPVTCSRQSGPDKISTLNQWPELTCLDFCLCDKIADCFMWVPVHVVKVIFKALHWIELMMLIIFGKHRANPCWCTFTVPEND